ncbi:MAG: hypothetical protein CM1200mP4_4150 [Rhodospirillaceae bacterium]|nr:MAG: hypothetical protein CM1200mP4_4150 [Rhodospirillaceae bacterium]
MSKIFITGEADSLGHMWHEPLSRKATTSRFLDPPQNLAICRGSQKNEVFERNIAEASAVSHAIGTVHPDIVIGLAALGALATDFWL